MTMARKKSVLTDKQSAYVEARLDGKSQREAALDAGYAIGKSNAILAEKSHDVRAALASARAELSSAAQMKRADVVEMLKEAYDMAKLGSEPASMVSAAREIGKMLGFYEPEKIKVELSTAQARLQDKYTVMSDEELLEIVEGTARVIDGEFQRLS
jgi:phage terminase small subunit